jgi:HEXXH motif-containing protein
MDFDWSRVAEPQPDQYDTEVVLARLGQVEGFRRPLGDTPTIFDGAVAVRPLEGPYLKMGFSSAPLEDERIRLAESYVRQWPTVFQQFKSLIYAFYPLHDVSGARIRPGRRGYSSHSFESRIGTLCASIEDPIGTAEAFVHEMAHNKLRSLGIMFESTQGFIANDPQDLYPSPIRIGVLRPMTAVFHAEYSFIYVTQLYLMMLAADPEEEMRKYLLLLLQTVLTRMEEGFKVIEDNIRVDAIGRPFVDGFMDWAGRVLADGRAILDGERIAAAS